MQRRMYFIATLIFIAALALTACAPAADSGQQDMAQSEESGGAAAGMEDGGGLSFIAVQHAECAWDSFWCTVQSGINTAAEDLGVDVTILAPDEFDLDKTASLIEQAVAANPDGIMLTVTDPILFREPIMKAINAGIPVIAYNAGSGPIADNIPYYTYLGQDEYQGGYLGGLRLAAGGGTQGVCINQQVGHTGLDKRCAGFSDALAESGIPAEVLAIGDDPAEAATIIGDYYTANPDTDIFLTLGPNGANPFYVFVENEGLTADDITHGTFDLGDGDQCQHHVRHDDVRHRPAAVPAGLWRRIDSKHDRPLRYPASASGLGNGSRIRGCRQPGIGAGRGCCDERHCRPAR